MLWCEFARAAAVGALVVGGAEWGASGEGRERRESVWGVCTKKQRSFHSTMRFIKSDFLPPKDNKEKKLASTW